MPISDEQAERAGDYMRDHADEAAQATANRAHLAEYRKSLKAILMGDKLDESGVAQERYAYSHPKYLEHLDALRIAIYEDEKQKYLMEAAKTKVSIWQSQIKARAF